MDELEKAFPASKIFRDLDSIEAGTDFVRAIDAAVGQSVVLLVVIGPRWLTVTNAAGARRLELADDFVRHEVATALRRGMRVIPVLVDGALPVGSKDLPEDIAALSRLQAHELSEKRWDYDVGQLLGILKRVDGLAPREGSSAPPVSKRAPSSPRSLVMGMSAVAALVSLTLSVVFYFRSSAVASGGTAPDGVASASVGPSSVESSVAAAQPSVPQAPAASEAPAVTPPAASPSVALEVVRNQQAADGGWPVYATWDEVGRNGKTRICRLYPAAPVKATCQRTRNHQVSRVLRVESPACTGYISSDAFVRNKMLPQRVLTTLPACP